MFKFTKGKGRDSQRCQPGHSFSSSCQVGVNNTDKKEILAIGQALVRSLATTFFSVLAGEMNVVYIMGWRTELFTNTIGHKRGSWAGTLLTRSCFKVHFKHNSNPR